MRKQVWYGVVIILVAIAVQTDCKATAGSQTGGQADKQGAASKEKAESKPPEFSYDDYQSVLDGFVRSGRVNYAALKADAKAAAKLTRFAGQLAKFDLSTLSSADEKEAFWINAYNALVIDGALRKYPVDTLRPAKPKGGFDDSFFTTKSMVVAGEKLSLKDIEERLRKESYDPRVHFALACGAAGGALLDSKVFTGKTVDDRLDEIAKEFFRNPANISFDKASSKLKLSQIFEWYKPEFEDDAGGTVVEWMLDLLNPELATQVKNVKAKEITYIPFDWKLNSTD